MTSNERLITIIDRFPRVAAANTPTALHPLANLGGELGLTLLVKRDDETGFGFGGNKVRQLEFYLGEARAEKADTILITGAVQSNFVRTAATMARRYGMQCHIQLEERVPNSTSLYRENGNVLLDRLLGATIHSFPEGEDEAAADAALERLAEKLRREGRHPYVIHLGADHPPLGALGYVCAALELKTQLDAMQPIDEIVVASGSALTHVGLLMGLRCLDMPIPVRGICVRRGQDAQSQRVKRRVDALAAMMDLASPVAESDIRLFDGSLAPGYGMLNEITIETVRRAAQTEGLFLDPAYTGKVMAGLIQLAESNALAGRRVLFWHTGGLPALFGYADQLAGTNGI
jgi:D-cysteine desulfhydrase family pyridoxal phosphate-dependent enzyme